MLKLSNIPSENASNRPKTFPSVHRSLSNCRYPRKTVQCTVNDVPATKPFGKTLGVVGFGPRTPSLEHTRLPTRVQSSAPMRTAIAVQTAF